MERHFTGTVYIVDADKVLLHFHHKLQVWLPFGGHVEEGETPCETAIREAKEECGLNIEILPQENVWVKEPNAQTIPRPYLCLLENVPPYRNEPPQEHIDYIFLGKPIGGKLFSDPLIRWFTLEDIEALDEGIELFAETKQVLQHLFCHYPMALSHKSKRTQVTKNKELTTEDTERRRKNAKQAETHL